MTNGQQQATGAQRGGSTFGTRILTALRAPQRIHESLHEITATYSPWFLLLPIALLWLDFFTGFNGICIKGTTGIGCEFASLEFLDFIIKFFISTSYWVVLAFIFIFKARRPTLQEIIYYSILYLLVYASLLLGGFSIMILFHIALAGFIYIYILKGFDKEQPITQAHWVFLFLFWADTFLFPALYGLNKYSIEYPIFTVLTSRLLLPIWFFYMLSFTREGFGKALITFIVVLFYIGYLGVYMYPFVTAQLAEIPQEQKTEFVNAPFKAVKNYWLGITEVIEKRLDYATGGLYRGSVEKNQYESLGVYFSNIRASEPKFYSDEPVTIWGSIRSKTYQDPVIVNFKCYRWKTSADKQNRIESKTYEPKNPFLVFQLEQNDVECTFRGNDPNNPDQALNVGQNTVTLSAEYNFATNAYKKAYFMDKDRYRALIKESIDPFKEFGIKDTQPKPVYTNGPVEIGIDVQALNPVSDSYVVYPTLGISLLNRKSIEDKNRKIITQWEGRIKNITELVVLMPPGIDIANKENLDSACSKENIGKGECPCNRPFKTYKVEDCRTSCALQVWNPCQKACDFYEDVAAKDRCRVDCSATLQNCNNECNNLFGVGEEGIQNNAYNGYALDVERLEYKNEYKDIESDRHRTFVCRIKPTTQVLDNTPITTRYFRVRARYNYLLENSVPVNVEQVPGAISPGVSKSITQYALAEGVDPDLVKAIAVVEGGGIPKHCKDGSTECAKENVILSSRGSLGLMQINVVPPNGFPEWKTDASSVCKDTVGKTAYEIDCNIKLGIKVLKDKYNSFKNGASESVLQQYCPKGSQYYEMYKSYRGWDAAIRGYNGWGCGAGADVDYVKKVQSAYNDINNNVISDAAKSSLEKIEKYFPKTGSKPSPPSNANAFDTTNAARSITISWSPSATSSVRYGVYRYSPDGMSFAQYTDIGQTSYVDNSVEDNVDYYYKITAVSDTDESESIQTASVKSVDDTITFT